MFPPTNYVPTVADVPIKFWRSHAVMSTWRGIGALQSVYTPLVHFTAVRAVGTVAEEKALDRFPFVFGVDPTEQNFDSFSDSQSINCQPEIPSTAQHPHRLCFYIL